PVRASAAPRPPSSRRRGPSRATSSRCPWRRAPWSPCSPTSPDCPPPTPRAAEQIMSDLLRASAIGTCRTRLEGPDKVRGRAPYAYEHPVEAPLFLYPLCSTIPRGRVTSIDASAALALDGVAHVLTHHDALRLADTEDGEL